MDNKEKLKLLLDNIDIEERDEELYICFKNNIFLEFEENVVQKSNKSIIIKTNLDKGHNLYLNPHSNHDNDSVFDFVGQSYKSYQDNMVKFEDSKPNTTCDVGEDNTD